MYTECSKSEKEKQILYINAYIRNIENDANEPICRAGIETQMKRMDLRTQHGDGEGGMN